MRTLKKCAGGCGRYVITFGTENRSDTQYSEIWNYCATCRKNGAQGGTIHSFEVENGMKRKKEQL